MAEENVEVVKRIMGRFAEQDVEAALEDVDPDAVLDWSSSDAPDSGVFAGRAAIGAFMQARDEVMGDRRLDSTELIAPAADTVVAVVHIREQGRASGVEVESRGATVWTLRERKVIRLKLYQSREEALKAAGLQD